MIHPWCFSHPAKPEPFDSSAPCATKATGLGYRKLIAQVRASCRSSWFVRVLGDGSWAWWVSKLLITWKTSIYGYIQSVYHITGGEQIPTSQDAHSKYRGDFCRLNMQCKGGKTNQQPSPDAPETASVFLTHFSEDHPIASDRSSCLVSPLNGVQ